MEVWSCLVSSWSFLIYPLLQIKCYAVYMLILVLWILHLFLLISQWADIMRADLICSMRPVKHA